MALFLFKDFWEEGDGRYWEFTENGIFKVPTARWEGQNLDVALLAIFVAAFVAQAIAWKNRLNLFY